MNQMSAVIIDDMPLAIASLKADLEAYHSEVNIVGTAEGVISGAKAIRKLNPDFIFLDIHMGDGDGFELLEIIADADIKVIFTTASQDHAVQAFRFEAVDYLLKPISPDLLRAALSKMQNVLASSDISVSKNKADSAPRSIALNTQEEIRLVEIAEIMRLESMGNYTTFYISGDRKILVTKTMGEFEKVLGDAFIRVHQSHLVNRNQISAYIKTEGGYLKMKDGSDVPVSVRKKSYVMEILKTNR